MNFVNYDIADVEIVKNPSALSIHDLVEEYDKLTASYMQHKVLLDHCKQQVYTLKKEKDLKDKILNQELQVITENYEGELKETKIKHSIQIGELQSRLTDTRSALEKLELENQQLQNELTTTLNEQSSKPCPEQNTISENETIVSKKRMEYLTKIENEFIQLTAELAQVKSEKAQLMSQVTQKQSDLDEVKEYYECSKQNLEYKTDELNEAQLIIESLQEKLVEIENELLSYKNGKPDHNSKGNSLFAEVDDQRQQMRAVLSRQKQQYLAMKSKYELSSGEINRLKRENTDILNGIKECANMFKSADKIQKSKFYEEIGFLKMENNRLNEKLKQIQLDMDTLAKTHGVNWLSSVLEYCEKETKELKSQLVSYGMKKSEAEGLYAQAQETAAKWRFEALKNRCIIMNRELLLENNNINFDAKLQNVRQIIDKEFDTDEKPIIDDALTYTNDSFKPNISMFNVDSTKPISSGSWSDVREIFSDNFNYHTSNSTSSNVQNDSREDNTIVLLPKEKPPIQETLTPFSAFNSVSIIKSEPIIKCEEHKTSIVSVENKENINSNEPIELNEAKNKSDTSIKLSYENSTKEETAASLSITKPENVQQNSFSVLDSQDRVKHVNVEMFTVTFGKRKDSSVK
ncbi:protein Spindly [Contarinia nasturtii]|uniref:protein Spindly n=1 Tax=Contarinia nasturtii TaxID=265458 RepID=UPI0012D49486|nr:protein Spindly [Contarinia nasturtii]